MKKLANYGVCVVFGALAMIGVSQVTRPSNRPNPDSQYRLGPDSFPHDGVPKGEIRGPFTLPCNIYPGTQHTYWVYVPAQYDPKIPTALMVFQDGQAFKDDN